jgi:hypothetical protein
MRYSALTKINTGGETVASCFRYDFCKAQCGRSSWELTGRARQTALSLLRLSWRKLLARNFCILTVGGNLSGQELNKLGRIEGDISEALEELRFSGAPRSKR